MAALTELETQRIGNDPETGIERGLALTVSDIRIEHLMMLWTRVGPVDFFDFEPGEPLADPRPLHESAMEALGMRFASFE